MALSSLSYRPGNLLIGQSGGPTAVINATLAGVLHAAHANAFNGRIFGMAGGIEGFLAGQTPFDLSQLSPAQIEQLKRTSAAALGSCRIKLTAEDYPRLLELFEYHDIRYFFYIGGNGSMQTPFELDSYARREGYELYCVGLPKTVDNDLVGTDHAPGYGSAARWLAQTTQDSGLDLWTMRGFDQVKIIEAMGRHAGWLAAATLLARADMDDPPHIVLVPEQIFDEATFLSEVEAVYRKNGCVLVVASEGLHNANGEFLAELNPGNTVARDAIGKRVLGLGAGVAGYLCDLVSRELKLKTRFDKPGTLQRGAACVSDVDRREAFELGVAGLGYALNGQTSVMPGLVRVSQQPYQCEIRPVALTDVFGHEKRLPAEFLLDWGVNVEAFRAYAAPLIGTPLEKPLRLGKVSSL